MSPKLRWQDSLLSRISPISLTYGLALAAALTTLAALLTAMTMLATQWGEDVRFNYAIFNYLSILVGGLYAGKKAVGLGWFHGGLVGALYLFLASWLFGGASGPLNALAVLGTLRGVGALAVGAFGGVLGVNLAADRKSGV